MTVIVFNPIIPPRGRGLAGENGDAYASRRMRSDMQGAARDEVKKEELTQ